MYWHATLQEKKRWGEMLQKAAHVLHFEGSIRKCPHAMSVTLTLSVLATWHIITRNRSFRTWHLLALLR
jgi:hypothetical protein